ncbi:ABC transporter permease [Thermithiobacillus plumbiphilus]|uniref:ABC transporter permease n=1 Tax=Thermithiobacillus plumbiphilus TaxID=1729899 RepID=A0ABU9D6B4_9PROT
MRRGWLSAGWLGLLALAALLAPLWTQAAMQVRLEHILSTPALGQGVAGWLGHDELGRPLLPRLLLGARTSLLVGLVAALSSAIVGTLIGMLAGYWGGRLDHLLVRVMDVFLAFPGILLAIALAGILGPGINNVIIALTVMGWVGFARLARAQTLAMRHREHVAAALTLGVGRVRILLHHVLPLILAPLTVEASFAVAGAVLSEAGLSFLGLGVQPPAASWGQMIREGTRYMLVAPHLVLFPGLLLMSVVLAANILGDVLRDRLDVNRIP